MKTLIIISAAALTMAAHDKAPAGKELSLTALVVDTGCYMSHNSKGEKHADCAAACAKAGVPLALLDEMNGNLYLPVAVDHKNANAKLMPFIEKKVKVTGTAMDKGVVRGIALKTVEAAQ